MTPIQFNPAPAWSQPYAPNMTYAPKSKPAFSGDVQHDFRDYQYQVWAPAVIEIVSRASQKYLNAARMMRLRDDPIADCLDADDRFDPQSFFAFYAHLAAYWRKFVLPERLKWDFIKNNFFMDIPEGRCVISPSYVGLQHSFLTWVLGNMEYWALYQPTYIRQICTIVAREHSVQGYLEEINLFDLVQQDFPL